MPAYKKMYFEMFLAAEDAISLLIAAQKKCEELYISEADRNETENGQGKSADGD